MPSMAMTWLAPISRATAHAYTPSPPAPWTTTVCPARSWAMSRPAYTWVYAQLMPAAISSVISGVSLNTAWFGRR